MDPSSQQIERDADAAMTIHGSHEYRGHTLTTPVPTARREAVLPPQ
ncbi:hypothetical protein [Hymenobacter rubripertinctus]|nr:hypothetical protein [Hymenobacter rubripertinctus]